MVKNTKLILILVGTLFGFGVAANIVNAEKNSLLPISQYLLDRQKENISVEIRMKMPPSKVLDVDRNAKSLISDSGQYPKILIRKDTANKNAPQVMYGFSDKSPELESLVITDKVSTQYSEQVTNDLTELLTQWGMPNHIDKELQGKKKYMALTWNLNDASLLYSYISLGEKSKSTSDAYVITRIMFGSLKMKNVIRKVASLESATLLKEKEFLAKLTRKP